MPAEIRKSTKSGTKKKATKVAKATKKTTKVKNTASFPIRSW